MTWYILALVIMLETNKPEIKINMSISFRTEEHCNNFIRTYKDAMLTQFKSDYPKIKLKHFVCVDNETGKEIQRQLYGDGDNDTQS
mgnify:FL=1